MEPRLNGIWPKTGLRPASKLDSVMEFGFQQTFTSCVYLTLDLSPSSCRKKHTGKHGISIMHDWVPLHWSFPM